MDRKRITQSYVLTPDGSEYMLRYYLVTRADSAGHSQGTSASAQGRDEGERNAGKYGVMIEEHSSAKCISETRYFSSDERAAREVIELLASGFVFPSTVGDVLDELIPASALVS